ncbi:hypothetical protein AAMO2058_000501000 [Amorphochlora amoebiformis]|eukprot:773607-Amorphochlora_amoeboformis.AAC.1
MAGEKMLGAVASLGPFLAVQPLKAERRKRMRVISLPAKRLTKRMCVREVKSRRGFNVSEKREDPPAGSEWPAAVYKMRFRRSCSQSDSDSDSDDSELEPICTKPTFKVVALQRQTAAHADREVERPSVSFNRPATLESAESDLSDDELEEIHQLCGRFASVVKFSGEVNTVQKLQKPKALRPSMVYKAESKQH